MPIVEQHLAQLTLLRHVERARYAQLSGLARTGGRRQEQDRDRDAGETKRHCGARLRDARCLRREPGTVAGSRARIAAPGARRGPRWIVKARSAVDHSS